MQIPDWLKRPALSEVMRFYPGFQSAAILLVAGLLLAGCAGTARGVKQSTYQHDENLAAVDRSRSQADAMVVIRYPAVVDDDAQNAYLRLFEQNAIGGEVRRDGQSAQEADRIAQSVIAKSNYFSMSLYRELRLKLPDDTVLLSPHIIELVDGHLISRPLLASEEIPSVLTIDFSVYTFPDAGKMMASEPLTFGDIVTPLFVVHANRWLRPSTHGLLLSSEPLVDIAWLQSEQQAAAQVASRLENRLPDVSRSLDFVSFLDRGTNGRRDLPLKSPGESRRDVIAVEIHPLEKIRMDGETVAHLDHDSSVDPFAEDFVKGAATRVVTALNTVNHDRATFFTRQSALSQFDPQLGAAFLSRSRDEALRARLQMGEALIAAERKFLSAQSANLYQGVYEGIYGDQMREIIAAEYELLEERRDLSRRQNLGTALAILAMAGAMYAGNSIDSGDFFESQTMGNILAITSLWAASSAFSAHAQSKIVGENFLAQMAPAISRQVTVQLEWLESREEITAGDFAEFRNQTLALYQRSARSIPAHEPAECNFLYPGRDSPGRWFGHCSEGMASGSGYGLLIDDQGNTTEYVGTASAGLAEGNGAMILRSSAETGAVYIEGGFQGGLPDGVVRVEEPGRRSRVRLYRAGRDAGSADPDELPRIQF